MTVFDQDRAKSAYGNPLLVGAIYIIATILVLALYAGFIAVTEPLKEHQKGWADLVTEAPDQTLTLDVKTTALSSRYSVTRVANAYAAADQVLDLARPDAIKERARVYSAIAAFLCRHSTDIDAILPVLSAVAGPAIINPDAPTADQKTCQQALGNVSVDRDVLVQSTSPASVKEFLLAQTLSNEGARAEQSLLVKQLDGLITSEAAQLGLAKAHFAKLSKGIHFRFINSNGKKWLAHLLFLSWIGVLVSAIGNLVSHIRENPGTPCNADDFILVRYRFLTAPITAVIIVAASHYGFTEESLDLSDRPLFLLFGFTSGFMSESFNALLKKLLNGLIPNPNQGNTTDGKNTKGQGEGSDNGPQNPDKPNDDDQPEADKDKTNKTGAPKEPEEPEKGKSDKTPPP